MNTSNSQPPQTSPPVLQPHLNRFAELMVRDQFGLAEASFLIAEDAYPAIDVGANLVRLDEMAAVMRARLAADAFAEQRIVALNYYLFEELGFRGDIESYYDPRNSYLNQVIERRIGIPITLSILYMELGRRIGLALQGVSFPGHFLVKLRVNRGQLVLDPFAGGKPQSQTELRARLEQVLPAGHDKIIDLDPYLEAATPRQIIARMLRNLKAIYLQSGQTERALAVMHRMLLVVPESTEELRDRGLIYYKLDCFRAALSDLENYLRRRPEAPDATEVHGRVVELKSACARLN